MDNDHGYIPVDEWGEDSFVVPIQHFDFTALDKPEDYIKEAVMQGKPVMPIVAQLMQHREADIRRDGAVAILAELYVSSDAEAKAHASLKRSMGDVETDVGMSYVAGFISGSKEAKRAVAVLCVAAGVPMLMGKSGPELAAEFGISKQAMQQAAERIRRRLALPKTRTMRSAQSRKNMAKAYNQKHKGK